MNCYFLYTNYVNVNTYNCIILHFFKSSFVLKNDYIHLKKPQKYVLMSFEKKIRLNIHV